MRRRWKILLLTAGGLIVVVAVCFFCLREKQPSYNGRTVMEWIHRFGDVQGSDAEAVRQRAEAARAIRQIGTNGIPVLLQQFDAAERTTKFIRRVPRILEPLAIAVSDQQDYKRVLVQMGFDILGDDAASAVPGLLKRFRKSSETREMSDIAYLMMSCGVSGLRALLDVARGNEDVSHRVIAITAFKHYSGGTILIEIVPVLTSILHDRDRIIRIRATNTLEAIAPVALTNRIPSAN